MISKKTKWVASDGWRGRVVPINAVCGANDTGTFSDSPCPSSLREREIKLAKSVLKKQGIKHVTMWGRSSNVFCSIQYVLVEPDNIERARQLIEPLREETSLLYVV